ncbi:MAG: UDP-N-acetylmuramoyl-tripeptide--D-alanyl-D-alanine ligase [Saprospiraceae bacterium]|nr:UDP-N-acetylmuramoyl-tripeptide--D-alanyl-D-alanine ligase [Saprospiraceae bacterium]
MNVETFYPIFQSNPDICTDSRKITPNCLFFALKGENFNGNDFALKAIDMGADYAIVDDVRLAEYKKCIVVDDVLRFLQQLATYHRRSLRVPVIAITGSNGKTTSKELIRDVLRKKFNLIATVGNLNNHIGVPLTILMSKSDTELLIVEMGANHQTEIDFLCRIAEPEFGVITNVGKAHLEGFGGFEGVKKGKSELYRYLSENEGTIFLNAEDIELADLVPSGSRVVSYHPSELLTQVDSDPFITCTYKGGIIKTQLIGSFNLANISLAIAIGNYFGVDDAEIVKSISSYSPDNNRSQLKRKDDNIYVMDAYNANPSSMALSIKSFASSDFEKKILVIGDMLELGEESKNEHFAIISLINEYKWQDVLYVGKHFYQFNGQFKGNFFLTSTDAANYLHKMDYRNVAFLLKGSRGIALEKIMDV